MMQTTDHSLTSIPVRTRPTIHIQTLHCFHHFWKIAFPTPYTVSICHIPCRSIVSFVFSKSINTQNASFPSQDTFHTPALQQTIDPCTPLPCMPKPTLLLPYCTFSPSPNSFNQYSINRVIIINNSVL